MRMREFPSLIIAACLAISQASIADEHRYLSDGIFVSESTPPLRVRVKESFEYLGNVSFVLKEIANVDRHHWILANDDEVTAMVILQFEGFRDGVNGRYQFNIPVADEISGSNYRYSPTRVNLGEHDYVHNTWAYDNGASIRENPAAEPAYTAKLLAEHGYTIQDELIMSRFVREVGEEQRDEFIVFYIEPLSNHGMTLSQFSDGGPANDIFDSLSDEITQRSLDVIEIIDSQ